MKRGYRTSILGVPIYRKTVDDQRIKHYTTTILESSSWIINGFSDTDYRYISFSKLFLSSPYGEIARYQPRLSSYAMPFILVFKRDGTPVLTEMSADVILQYEKEALEKVLKRKWSLSIDDLMVYDLEKGIIPLDKYTKDGRANYMPYLRSGIEYSAEHPDATLVVDDKYYRHVIDVFGKYYVYVKNVKSFFYGKLRCPVFMGYYDDLVDMGAVPNLKIVSENIDSWRTSRFVELNNGYWLPIILNEWCGSYSESENMQYKLYQQMIHDLEGDHGFDGVCAIHTYTSNVFVIYNSFLIHVSDVDKAMRYIRSHKLLSRAIEMQSLEDIITNIFNLEVGGD